MATDTITARRLTNGILAFLSIAVLIALFFAYARH